jgi:hypothetical protein
VQQKEIKHNSKSILMKTFFLRLLATLAVGTVLAAPAFTKWWSPALPVTAPAASNDGKADPALIRELADISRHLDSVRRFYVEGKIIANDPSDSINQLNADFTYATKDDRIYSKLGDQEMLYCPEFSLTVNHSIKKIFLAPPSNMAMPYRLPWDTMMRMINDEGYHVSSSSHNSIATIRLVRENHASCKEYAVSYDTATHLIQHVFLRLTNLADPFNKKSDRKIHMNFSRWQLEHVPDELFDVKKWIRKEGEEVAVADGLSAYELILTANK